jgi:hypothetical protein
MAPSDDGSINDRNVRLPPLLSVRLERRGLYVGRVCLRTGLLFRGALSFRSEAVPKSSCSEAQNSVTQKPAITKRGLETAIDESGNTQERVAMQRRSLSNNDMTR